MMPEALHTIIHQAREEAQQTEHTIRVCTAAGCVSANSVAVKTAIAEAVEGSPYKESCRVKGVGCMGLCSRGPLVSVTPRQGEAVHYQNVTPEDAAAVLTSLDKGPVKKLRLPDNMPFFTRQTKIVLENSGRIDPERLEDYVAAGGYQALNTALDEMTPEEVIREVVTSGLRGRGGGGYPTGLKWSTVAKANHGVQKYVICNADEGDPGAFMDRSILESDPHRVLEGMAIAGYAVGANKGYIYIRGEYPLAIDHLQTAIRQAKRNLILGHGIFSSTFDFDVELRIGAGAFVCGEETALIASIEGNRGVPRPRPPYPAEYGLWGCPTLINNVETYANIAPIILRGGEWFAGIGTEKSTGTKVFALAGQITNTGLVEIPMGMSLRELIDDIGGGVVDGKRCKAVQTGGPSGGCIPADRFDTPVDYESLRELGSIMGSGGMIVMDEDTSMVGVARYFMEFCRSESCGKCIPCRVGTAQMEDILDRFVRKEATAADLALLEELCEVVKHTSLCGLGQSAPNPVLSTMRYFRDEYLSSMTETAEAAE